MNWTDSEQLFIVFRLENWVDSWSLDYADAYDELVGDIVQDHNELMLTVDESVCRYLKLNQYIRGLANERTAA